MLYRNSGNKVRVETVDLSGLVLLMKLIAELRCSINAAIPKVVNFLKDNDEVVRWATVESLSQLSDRGRTVNLVVLALFIKIIAEFRPLIVTAIPELLTLLKDSDISVRKAYVAALSKFSEQGKPGNLSNLALLMRIIVEFRALIGSAVLNMVKSVNDDDNNGRLVHINVLSKLSQQGKRGNWSSLAFLMEVIAKFRPTIATIIPAIVALLNENESSVCVTCVEALLTLSEQGKTAHLSDLTLLMTIIAEFRSLTATGIPAIVNLLKDSNSTVLLVKVCLIALSTLSEQGKLYSEFSEFNFTHHNHS